MPEVGCVFADGWTSAFVDMDFDQRLALLRSRYVDSLPSKRSLLLDAWTAVRQAPEDEALQVNLRTLLHRLAGSAPSYGYPAIGDVAASASHCLAADGVGILPIEELAHLIDQLLAMLATASPSQRHGGDSAATGPASETLRVILVEDDPDQAAAIAGALSAQGCTVRHAEHSESFWEVVTTWPCDAVVIDYWLSAETARDIVALVRNEPTFASIALLCLTVETSKATLKALLDAGCDAVLPKHEAAQSLMSALHDHVSRRRAAR
jgi:CheY-like chemotaxis protein